MLKVLKRLLLCICCWLTACSPAVSDIPLPTPFPTIPTRLESQEPQNGLLLMVLDGIRDAEIEQAMDEDRLPTLKRLIARGQWQPVTPVEPTLAQSGLATLLSSQEPYLHGWLGGNEIPILTPFWTQTSNVYGALIGDWPQVSADSLEVWFGPTGAPLLESRLHEPQLAPAQRWVGAPPSFSPRLEAHLILKETDGNERALFLLAVDTLNDNRVAYDQYWLTTERELTAEGEAVFLDALAPGWVRLPLDERLAIDFLLLDGRAESLRLYQSAAVHARPVSQSLQASLAPPFRIGYPPPPDITAYQEGWLDAEHLRQMVARQNAWLLHVATVVWESAPDGQAPLLMLRLPALGQLHTELLLLDPAQPDWELSRQQQYQTLRQQILIDLDHTLPSLLTHLDLSRQPFFLTSPLGIEPWHKELSLPLLLQQGNLNPDTFQIWPHGQMAWLYGSPDALTEATNYLSTAIDPESKYLFFDAIRQGDTLGGSSNSLLLQSRPGYLLSTRQSGSLLTATPQLGGTGGLPSPNLAGWWLAVGSGIRHGASTTPLELTTLPRSIAHLLGIPPLTGKPVPGWLD